MRTGLFHTLFQTIGLSKQKKIVGGVDYDDRDSIALYIKKYEILIEEDRYLIKLPLGQSTIEKACGSENEAFDLILDHFREMLAKN